MSLERKASSGLAALITAGTLSIILVVATGFLIAFMQFQARILSSSAGFTTGQLIDNVETERTIKETNIELKILTKEISDSYADISKKQTEVAFRTDRICAMFNNAINSPETLGRCHEFISQIPTGITSAPANKNDISNIGIDSRSKVKDLNVNTDIIQNIENNFVIFMTKYSNNVNIDEESERISKQIGAYSTDFRRISEINEDIWIDKSPDFHYKLLKYGTLCKFLSSIVKNIHYRDYTRCSSFDEELYAASNAHFSAGEAQVSAAGAVGTLIAPSMISKLENAQEQSGGDRTGSALGTNPTDPKSDGYRVQPSVNHPFDVAPTGLGQSTNSKKTPAPPAMKSQGIQPKDESLEAPSSKSGADTTHAEVPVPPVGALTSLGGNQTANSDISLSTNGVSLSEIDKQRDFELVNNYLFYSEITFGLLRAIIISPTEFLAFILVCCAGLLGSLLRIVLLSYRTAYNPRFRDMFVSSLLGIICALVIYALFRSGFVVLTERANDQTNLSPFTVALLAMGAGLLSEQAIEKFQMYTGTLLGQAPQAERWAVNLANIIKSKGIDEAKIGAQLQIDVAKVTDWKNENEPVPFDRQRDLSLILGVPARQIFTDISPTDAV